MQYLPELPTPISYDIIVTRINHIKRSEISIYTREGKI